LKVSKKFCRFAVVLKKQVGVETYDYIKHYAPSGVVGFARSFHLITPARGFFIKVILKKHLKT